MTSRGFAVFSGVILGGFGVLALLVNPISRWSNDFMVASWLPPIVLFPGAALAAGLGGLPSDRFNDHARVLWPAYVGLALYGLVVGHWWFYFSRLAALVAAVHALAFILVSAVLAPFPNTRSAALQIGAGYLVLLGCWVVGSLSF